MKELPKLTIVDENTSFEQVLNQAIDECTLVIVTPYNMGKYADHLPSPNTVVATEVGPSHLESQINGMDYDNVVAIGGCRAIDIGRHYANESGAKLTALPTVLSTSCISNDWTIKPDERIRTTSPDDVVISLDAILDTPRMDLEKWSSSGFGDLFSNLSASIDKVWKEGDISYGGVAQLAQETLETIDYANSKLNGFSKEALVFLAGQIHDASVQVIKDGNLSSSSAGEHKLYHAMVREQNYGHKLPTHGQIVAVGTLVAVRAWANENMDYESFELLENLRTAYQKLGLPTSYQELESIGIEKEHLVSGLQSISEMDYFLSDYIEQNGTDILDSTFGESRHFHEAKLDEILGARKKEIEDQFGAYEGLADHIASQISQYHSGKVVVGLSGGIDSAVVAYLAVKALGAENVITINLPGYAGDPQIQRAEAVAKDLGTEHYTISIADEVSAFQKKNKIPSDEKIRIGNFASRTRVAYMLDKCTEEHARLLGSGNLTEFVQGYATFAGTPNTAHFDVLKQLYKVDVDELAKTLGVPDEILDAEPSTGFYPGQTHAQELGGSMREQDAVAYLMFGKCLSEAQIVDQFGASPFYVRSFADKYKNSEWKRIDAPCAEVKSDE